MPTRKRRLPLTLAPFALLAAAVGVCGTAHAGLGDRIESLQRDRLALHGTSDAVTTLQAYDVHETATADGTRVREYVSRSGTVFGVAWNGRSKPDLSVLLASHMAEYRRAAAANRFNHKVLSVNTGGLVLQIVKLPREFAGSAYLPALLPDGAAGTEVR